jgi:hypothetical protein
VVTDWLDGELAGIQDRELTEQDEQSFLDLGQTSALRAKVHA